MPGCKEELYCAVLGLYCSAFTPILVLKLSLFLKLKLSLILGLKFELKLKLSLTAKGEEIFPSKISKCPRSVSIFLYGSSIYIKIVNKWDY